MARPVVFLTGCSSGIGRYMAAEFFARGCIVYATARKVESLSVLPEGVHKLHCDVLNLASIKAAVAQVVQEQGRIDILVNNAGCGTMCMLMEHDLEDAKKIVDTNIIGLVAVTQAVAPHMAAQGSGKILNIGSILGFVSQPIAGMYCATKYAIRSLSENMGFELRPFGIQVCLVAPGMIDTDIWQKQVESLNADSYKLHAPHVAAAKKAVADVAVERKTPADELAKTVVNVSLRRRIPRQLWSGRLSGVYWLLSWLPRWLQERIMNLRMHLAPVRPPHVKAD